MFVRNLIGDMREVYSLDIRPNLKRDDQLGFDDLGLNVLTILRGDGSPRIYYGGIPAPRATVVNSVSLEIFRPCKPTAEAMEIKIATLVTIPELIIAAG